MLAIGNSIAAGIGIAGGLSIIRFRTTMRDPRDMVFVFTALAAGIASGLQAYAAAIAGTAIFLIAALALDFTAFGARRHFDGLSAIFCATRRGRPNSDRCASQSTLRLFRLVTLREAAQGKRMEHAYQISVPNPDARNHLVLGLQALNGIKM